MFLSKHNIMPENCTYSYSSFIHRKSFCLRTGTFVVGFVETSYTVIEGDGQVEVCVNLISPEGDIGDERVLVEVFNNTDPGSIPADAAAASKLALSLKPSM